jgi:O-antigen/teichoic acid export membrane protein
MARRLKDPIVGTVATGLAIQALLAVSGPFLARMLGPHQRGQLAALLLWPTVIAYVGSLGIPAAATYYVAQQRSSARAIGRHLLSFAVLQTIILLPVHAVWLYLLVRDETTTVQVAAAITLVAIPAFLAQWYGLAILQGARRFREFNVVRLGSIATYAALILIFFVTDVKTLPLPAAAYVGSVAIFAIATALIAARVIRERSEPGEEFSRRRLVNFGLRGIIGTDTPLEAFRLDQIVLALFLGPAALGIYIVGLAFTNLPTFIGRAIGLVAFPSVASRAAAEDARRAMWRFLWGTFTVNTVMTVAILIAAPWLVPLFFGESFGPAVRITQILLPGMLFLSGRRVLSEGLKGRGLPTAGTIAELGALTWLAVALAVLTRPFGAEGVALAVTTSYAVSFGLVVLIAARRGEIDASARPRLPRAVAGRLGRLGKLDV